MIDLGKVPEEQRSPLVTQLLHVIEQQIKEIQQLKDEIARLKEHKGKPKIPPSRLEKEPEDKENKEKSSKAKRPGSQKRSKTKELIIHETRSIAPEEIPEGSTQVGHDDYIVQGLKIELYNIRYRLECWCTPEGKRIKGELPRTVEGHFSAELRSFALQQHYHCHVTQPLLLEELREMGVDISSGQVNRILTEHNDDFHREKGEVLCAGLDVSSYINVDDTGARHAGKNGYCTHIGNELFAWFESTGSKSRINFLELLSKGHESHVDYVINDDALEYIKGQSFPQHLLALLGTDANSHFESKEDWKAHLKQIGVTKERHVRIATQGALLGSILYHGFSKELVILSDDAGQFNILVHALCWIHAERTIHKLVACNQQESKAIETIRDQIWQLYRGLKAYKEAPDEKTKAQLEKHFDEIFAAQTCSEVLNAALQRIANNKEELLLVLDRPEIPLHNNLSECDIREYVKKRKISGSTRSEDGRRSQDTFISLKKTCRKLGVSFWNYLNDRVSKTGQIAPLPDLIRAQAQAP